MYIILIYLAIPVEIGPGAGQEASVRAGQRGLQPFLNTGIRYIPVHL
jgi:hypothetical protein